jgi:1,4-dihydroxy-2-naphthoyl-CoA hydrolase
MLQNIFKPEQISLDQLNQRCKNTMAEFLEINFCEITTDYLKASMPVNHKTVQPLRMLNGGASFALAENLGSLAANLVLDREKFVALGLDMQGNHLKPALEGQMVYGIARAYHIGKSTQVWDVSIENEKQELLCVCRLTMAVKSIA